MDSSMPGLSVPHYLPKFCASSCPLHQGCHPTISSWCPLHLLPSIFPSVRDLSSGSAIHIRWPKYWSFSFSISPSNKYSVLISLKIGWFDLLDVQGTFMNILRHHSLKASLIWHSAFFKVQLSQPYVTTGKTIALTIRTFVGRVMSCFSTHCLGLSLLSSKKQLSYYFMAAVTVHGDFGAQEEEICHYFHVLPFYLPCSNGAGYHDLSFF